MLQKPVNGAHGWRPVGAEQWAGRVGLAVGVGLDTVKQVESQLQQRNYEGFLR